MQWNLKCIYIYILFLLSCVNAIRRKGERKSTCTCVVWSYNFYDSLNKLKPWDYVDDNVHFGSFVDL